MAGADEIKWSRRVKPQSIRRLYTLDAKGIVDEDLIDDVGYAIHARCLSIRAVTEAHAGRATCPRCRAMVRHKWKKEQPLICECGWQATWGEYFKSYQGKQLYGGQAYPIFRAFIDRWPQSRTPCDKMLAIDALIHACHGQFEGAMGRPAACNLIEGTMHELIEFLDALAYGDLSTPGVGEVRAQWRAGIESAQWLRGREYSKRLGVLTYAQLQAALSRFELGELLDAEPAHGGMFGQNVMLRATSGEWILRGAPHSLRQFPSERCYSRLIHERTETDAPWPYLLEPSTELFGWSYALMPRILGLALNDPEVQDSLEPNGRMEIARAMGEHLGRLQSATWEHPGDFSYEADDIVPLSQPYSEWFVARVRAWLARCLAVTAATGATTEDDVAWVESVIDEARDALAEPFDAVIVHTDYAEGNVVGEQDGDGGWRINGVFDLAESYIGDGEYDLARSGAWYWQRLGPDGLRAFVEAYVARRPLRPGYERRFPLYMLQDRLIFWEYGQRNKIWFRPGLTLRAWAAPAVGVGLLAPGS